MEKKTFIAENIKHLRKKKGLTQSQLADLINLKRSVIGSYEENRAFPRPHMLINLARLADVSVEDFISTFIGNTTNTAKKDINGNNLRILATVTNARNKELISLVPAKASAGYLNGYSDPEYIEELPVFDLPLPEFSQDKTYRAFQINGDSMKPIPSGSYILCEYTQDWEFIKTGETYIVVTSNQGIVYKRVTNEITSHRRLILISDNKEYSAFEIQVEDIIEIWKAKGYISPKLPNADAIQIEQLSETVRNLQAEIEMIKNTSK